MVIYASKKTCDREHCTQMGSHVSQIRSNPPISMQTDAMPLQYQINKSKVDLLQGGAPLQF